MDTTAKTSVPATEDVNVSDKIGKFHVATANVPAKGYYLTLVLRDMRPFDMSISDTVDAARVAHDGFIAAAVLYSVSHHEIDLADLLVPPEVVSREMMN